MMPVERVIATARAEIGYLEKASNSQLEDKTANAGDKNWNKFAAFLDNLGVVYNGKKNGYAWCDIFVDWCFIVTFGLDLGMALLCQVFKGLGAGCTYSMKYFKDKGQFFTSNPKPGDQIFFTNDGGKTSYHTGLVVDVKGGRVYTIEGNTSSLAGVVPNGGCVRDKSYPLTASYIAGYGRPNYSIVEKEETEEMNQEQFSKMFAVAMAAFRAELRDNDSGEWSEKARNFVIEKGIFAGGGTGTDGKPNYMWEDFLSREQAAQILYRFGQLCGLV